MRAIGGAENVMGAADVRDPIAHRFVDGFLQSPLAGFDRDDFRSQHFHAKNVEALPFAIDRPHVNNAFEAEHRRDGSGRDAVLAGASFGDDAGFAHAFGEQDLADAVVDFMRAGVEQVFALEINLCAAEFAGEAFGKIERSRAATEFSQVIVKFLLEFGVVLRAKVFLFKFLQRMHQCFRHVTTAIRAEVALGVRDGFCRNRTHNLRIIGKRGVVEQQRTSLWMVAGQGADNQFECVTEKQRFNMAKLYAILLMSLLGLSRGAFADVLIVADEFPAMEILAAKLKSEEQINSKIISQKELPENLSTFEAIAVYIHKDLSENAENAFIAYALGGGKLVLLHHSISSGKRKNAHWFSFLGVSLPEGDVAHGGYKWIEGVSLELVNLNPNHFIMTNKVTYPEHISYTPANAAEPHGDLAGFKLDESEVYLNHVLDTSRTLLMGLKYIDEKSGTVYMQSHAGWIKTVGKGTVIYLMPGHTKRDFENPTFGRIVLNAVICKP